MSSIKVVIVDRHALLREALKAILSTDRGISIVGEASTVDDAIDIISEQQPDIVLMSFLKPNLSGSSLIKKTRSIDESIRFIAFVDVRSTEIDKAIFEMKVCGLLRIDVSPDEIKLAVNTVFGGERHIDQRIAEVLFDSTGESSDEFNLSFRQLQVLRMIAEGFTNKRISAELGISHDTVKTHVRTILRKLKAADRAQAVSKAYELGVLRKTKDLNPDLIGWY